MKQRRLAVNCCMSEVVRRYRPLAWAAAMAAGGWSLPACAQETATAAGDAQSPPVSVPQASGAVEFNPNFFSGNVADLPRYARGNPVAPGTYPVDVVVNSKGQGRYDIQFLAVPGSDVAAPCFTLDQFERIGINLDRIKQRLKDMGQTGGAESAAPVCIPFAQAVPGATAALDLSDFKLDLSIPQIELDRTPGGYVNPARWDSGVTAGMVQYNLSTYSSQSQGTNLSSVYLGLQSGLNVNGWRFRQRSTLSAANQGSGTHWQNLALYAQHDITALKSQFTIGDSSTSGDVFDTINVRGVQFSSDDRMLPDALRSYVPVIRGVANSNARVTIRQGGNVIYETSVAPGPFEISDVSSTGYGGSLDVTVTEADGRTESFSVPYGTVPQLLRPGVSRFGVAVGQYINSSLSNKPVVAQGVYQLGLSNLLTGYAGAQGAAGYLSGLMGVALNTEVGAVAFDVTAARASLPTGSSTGYSARVTYSKLIPGINTNVWLGAYRYSTSRFYSLQDALFARDNWGGQPGLYDYRIRNRAQIQLSQRLSERSSVYVSGIAQDYWGTAEGSNLQYQVGFSSAFKRLSYSLYVQRSRDQYGQVNTQGGATLTLPLGGRSPNAHKWFDYVTAGVTQAAGGENSIQATASGSTKAPVPTYYGVTASRDASGSGAPNSSVGGNVMYQAPFGTLSGNASVGGQVRQVSGSLNGAMVVHEGGMTLSPPLGQAFALVEAKGAKGAVIANGQGARIDSNGYAIIPSLLPYHVNTIAIDPSTVSLDVDFVNTSEEVVPRADSLVKVTLATQVGRATFAVIEDAQGHSLPLGTELLDETGKSVGIVGQGGIAYLRGIEGKGQLQARWGGEVANQCVVAYDLPSSAGSEGKPARPSGYVKMHCDPSLSWPSSVKEASNAPADTDAPAAPRGPHASPL
jgi:outer membrane usher protein